MPADTPPKNAVRQPDRESGQALLSAAIEGSARQLTFASLLHRVLYLVAAAVLFPLVVVIADHTVPGGLPRALIFGAGILWGIVTVLAATGVSVRTLMRQLNRVFVARHVERSRGLAHNPLINLVLLQHSGQADYARAGAVRQAATVLATATATADSPGSKVSLRQPGLLFLAAIGLWLLYVAITPKPILPSLARLFGADRDAPTATRLELLCPPPDQPVYAAEPLEIEFAVSGRPVARVEFELLNPVAPDAPPLLRSVLQRSADARQRYRTSLAAHEVTGDLHYRCSAGDALVEGIIAVQRRPDLLDLQIELVPPAYVGEPTRQTTDPELRVWSGTRATFVALANVDLLDPIFIFRGRTETRTRMAVDSMRPRRAVLSLPLTESADYWLEFSDRWGRPCADPPTHRIVVRHDLAPRVEITTPDAEETPNDVVDVTHTAWLRATASDDVRLDTLQLVRDADGTLSRTSLLGSDAPAGGRSVEVGIATSDLPLEVGQSLRVWFEARDNRVRLDGTRAPQLVTSRELTLIRTPEVEVAKVGDVGEPVDLTDATGTTEQVVKRRRARPGEEGEPGDALDGIGQADGPVGPNAPGTKYRRVPGEGNDEEAAADPGERPEIGPEDVVEGGEGDTPQEGVEEDGQSDGEADTARQFEEELRRFGQEHGDEAREVNQRQRAGRQTDDAGSDESQAGQSEAGAGGGDDSPDEQDDSDSEAEPNAPESRPDNTDEADEQQPASQPSQPDQAEGERPPPPDQPDQEPGEEPARQEPQEQRDGGEDEATRPEESEQPEGRQQDGESEEHEEQPGTEQPESGADDETPAGSEEQPQRQDQAESQQEPGAQRGAEEGEQDRSDDSEQPSQSAADPNAAADERVIPMPDEGRKAQPPLPEPETSAERPDGEAPADAGQPPDVTDTLDLLGRAEEITEEDLTELDWPPARRRAFVRDFERLREAARRAGVLSQLKWWRTRIELGSAEVSPGGGLSQELSTEVTGAPSLRDGLDQIAPPAEQRVAPELRALLEAYYRSLAEKRAQQGAAETP